MRRVLSAGQGLKRIPLFGLGLKGKSANATSQHRINLFGEIQVDQDKSRFVLYGPPGKMLWGNLGETPARGRLAIGTRMFVVHRNKLQELNNGAIATERGTLNSSKGWCDLCTDGVNILIVDGTNGYTFTLATNTFAQIVDPNFPAAGTCTWLSGLFIVDQADSDSFFFSPDGINWDPLDFATAEKQPDGIVRIFENGGEIFIGGESSSEFWGTTGDFNSPFAPIRGASIDYGLAAKRSLVSHDGGMIGLFLNESQAQIMKFRGYTPVPASTPELDSVINGYAIKSDATGFSYMAGGHPIYHINFPSAGKSWEYDSLTNLWCERQSGVYGQRDRGEMACVFLGKTLVFDFENGKIYRHDENVYTDDGEPMKSLVRTRHFFNDYNHSSIGRLFVDFQTGVGTSTGQGSDPRAMLRVSRDGGNSWGTEILAPMGKIGEYLTRSQWGPLGSARDFVFEISVTDPVKRFIVNGAIEATGGLP